MINKLGVQLFTIRDFLKTEDDIKRSFEKLREIGYSEVQTAGMYPFISPQKFAQIANDNDIKIIGTHIPIGEIEENIDKIVEMHQAYDTVNVGIGAMPIACGEEMTLEFVEAFISRFNKCADKVSEYGFKLTYHNHDFDFLKHDGKCVMDRLIESFNENNTSFVIDTYWLQAGGVGILEYMNKCAGRLDILHLKDYKVIYKKPPIYTEIGNGNINFEDVVACAEKIGVKHYIVEQDDCPGNPFDSLATSYNNLKEVGLLK